MLKRAHIQNVLSCKDVLLDDVSPITALVGRNASGKSNIMRAIDWAARVAVSAQPLDPATERMLEYRQDNAIITFDFETIGITYRYTLNVTPRRLPQTSHNQSLEITNPVLAESLYFAGGSRWYPIFERNSGTIQIENKPDLQIGLLTPALMAIGSLLPQDDPVLEKTQPAIAFLRSIHYYPLDEPNVVRDRNSEFLVQESEYAEWLTNWTNSLDPTASVVMRLIDMSKNRKPDLEELKQLVGANGLSVLHDIEIQALSFPRTKTTANTPETQTFYLVTFHPVSSPKESRAYGNLSFGTRRILRVLVSLIFDKSSVMLLEQPEDGIHPGLLHKLIPLLKSYSDLTQVMVASHSPTVFNRLNPKEIRLVDIDEGATSVRALTKREIVGAERYISEDGPLSDYIETAQEGG